MTKEKKKFQPLTSKSICEIYNVLHNEGLISFPITTQAENKIDALVANINGDSFGIAHYPTNEEKVVAYLYFIIKNHAFTDGNKRTATLAFRVLCRKNNINQHFKNYDLDSLAVYLEQLKEKDYQKLIKIVAKTIFD